MKVAKAVKSS